MPDLTRTFVSAWAAVDNPDPADGGPELPLDGWRFRAAFEGATVVRSQTVTHVGGDSADPAFWEIQFTGGGPAHAVVTVVPQPGAKLLRVRCGWTSIGVFEPRPVPASVDGNTVSFDVGRGFESEGITYPQDYECFFVYARAAVPATDTVALGTAPLRGGLGLLAVMVGIVAGVVLAIRPKRRDAAEATDVVC